MVDVSIGVASACIAAVITLLQFLLPNALALILAGHVPEPQSAVTWSVVSRFLLTSDWPWFLRSDHTASTGVAWKVSLLTWIKPIGLLLIAVSAVVTPLGLYDSMGPSTSPVVVPFVYVSDNSVIGVGTPPRSSRGYNFSRICETSEELLQMCPGEHKIRDDTHYYPDPVNNITTIESLYVVDQSIPPALIDLYQGGLPPFAPSVSSFFDIQYRQWTLFSQKTNQYNRTLLGRASKWISSVFTHDKWETFEGLVADTKLGGIGFRNHSVPDVFSQYGCEWEEDILWMQPEAACVNTNLTAFFQGSLNNVSIKSADLVDRGGFANISRMQPFSYDPYPLSRGQYDPMLYERAYWLAWSLNYHAMLYLNITDPNTNRSRISSHIGQRFTVNSTLTKFSPDSDRYLDLDRGGFFDLLRSIVGTPPGSAWNASTNEYSFQENPGVPNPHNITVDAIKNITRWVAGYSLEDHVNISTIAVQMGYIIGPAVMLDQTEPNTASSIVTLQNLEILNIKDKVYGQKDRQPLWGFEMPWLNSTTTWNISAFNPLWGIVDESVQMNRNVSTIRSDHFYIPAGRNSAQQTSYSSDPDSTYGDFVAGTTGPADNWAGVFSAITSYGPGGNTLRPVFEEMTRNSTSVENLVELMWTDWSTNLMVGTRGIHTPRYTSTLATAPLRRRGASTAFTSLSDSNISNPAIGRYHVYLVQRQIQYRWIYGIPALICIGVVGLATLLALVGIICGNASITRLRTLMYDISVGRVFATFIYPELQDEKMADTKRWIQVVGHKPIEASGRSTSIEPLALKDTKGPHSYVQVTQQDDGDANSEH